MLYNYVDTLRFEGDPAATGLEQSFNISSCNNFGSLFHFAEHLLYKQWDPGVWELLGEEVPKLCAAVTRRITDRTSKLRKKMLCIMCSYKQCRPEQAKQCFLGPVMSRPSQDGLRQHGPWAEWLGLVDGLLATRGSRALKERDRSEHN